MQAASRFNQLFAALAVVAISQIAPATAQETTAFGNWQVNCAASQEGAAKACSAGQAVVTADKKELLFGWQWAFNAKNALVATLRTRPGLQQDKGILIQFKPKEPSVILFRECNAEFCETAFQVTRDQLADVLGASDIKLAIFPVEGKPISIKLPTKGLKEALQALKAK